MTKRPDIGKRPDKVIRETAALPADPLGTVRTATGTVKFFNAAKGWGAITTGETNPWDIWCIFAVIDGPGFRTLVQGERVDVEFERQDHDSFKYVARRVRRSA